MMRLCTARKLAFDRKEGKTNERKGQNVVGESIFVID